LYREERFTHQPGIDQSCLIQNYRSAVMTEDLKIDELNHCADVEPRPQAEDSGSRALQTEKDPAGIIEGSEEELGLAGQAIPPEATRQLPREAVEAVNDKHNQQLQLAERAQPEPKLDMLLV